MIDCLVGNIWGAYTVCTGPQDDIVTVSQPIVDGEIGGAAADKAGVYR
jgi:hypothetical protein